MLQWTPRRICRVKVHALPVRYLTKHTPFFSLFGREKRKALTNAQFSEDFSNVSCKNSRSLVPDVEDSKHIWMICKSRFCGTACRYYWHRYWITWLTASTSWYLVLDRHTVSYEHIDHLSEFVHVGLFLSSYFKARNGTYKRLTQKPNAGFEGVNGGMTVYYMQDGLYNFNQTSKVTAFKPVSSSLTQFSISYS